MAEAGTPFFTTSRVVANAIDENRSGIHSTKFSTGQPNFQKPDLADVLTMGPSLVLFDMINTMGSSLTFGAVDKDMLEGRLKEHLPAAYDFLEQNRGGIELMSGLAGVIVPGTLAIKAVNSTIRIAQALRQVPVAGRLLNDVAKLDKARAAVLARDVELAAKSGVRDSTFQTDLLRQELVKNLRGATIGKGFREGVAAELSIYLTQNQSGFLFPEEMEWYDHALFSAAGVGATVGLELILMRKLLRSSMATSGKLAGEFLNPAQLVQTDIISRPGQRDATVTMHAMNNAALDEKRITLTAENPVGATNLGKDQVQSQTAIRTTLKSQAAEIVADNISPQTTLSEEQLNSVVNHLKRAPADWVGVKHIQPYETPTSHLGRVKNLEGRTDKLRKEAQQHLEDSNSDEAHKLFAEIREFETWQPMIFRQGTWVPLEDDFARISDIVKHVPIKSERSPLTGLFTKSFANAFDPTTGKKLDMFVDEDFNMFLPGKRTNSEKFEDLTSYEISAVYSLYNDILEGTAVLGKELVHVTKNDHFTRLDAITEAISRGRLQKEKVTLPEGLDFDDIEMLSINKKFSAYQRLRVRGRQAPDEALQFSLPSASPSHINYALNLPGGEFGTPAPLVRWFEDHLAQGGRTLDGFVLQDIKDLSSNGNVVMEGLEFAIPEPLMRGTSLLKQEPAIFTFRKDLDPALITKEVLNSDMLMRHEDVLRELSKTPFLAAITRKIVNTGAYGVAKQVDGLHQGGLAGQAVVTTEAFAGRELPAIRGAHDLDVIAQKDARTFSESLYSLPNTRLMAKLEVGGTDEKVLHLNTFNELQRRTNAPSRFQLGEYMNARSAGWDLLPDAVPISTDKWGFVLNHANAATAAKFKAKFGRELVEGVMLPMAKAGPDYVPLEIGELAFRGAEAFRDIGIALRQEQNTIFRGMKAGELNFKDWWAPPKNFARQNVAYLVQTAETGDTIKMIFRSPSRKKLLEEISSRNADELVFGLDEAGQVLREGDQSTFVVRTDKEIEQFFLSLDRSFFDMVDVSDPFVRLGKPAKGSSASFTPEDPSQLIEEAITSINNQVNHIARDAMGLLFEGQLAYAQRAHNTAEVLPRLVDRLTGANRSVWQIYQDAVLGNRSIRRNSNIGKFYATVEGGYDQILLGLWEKNIGRALPNAAKSLLKNTTGIDIDGKRFAKMKSELGEFLPFESATEFAQSNFGVGLPSSMKQHMAGLNKLASGIILRWFEMAHPLLNLSGVVSTMPAVTNALKIRAGETRELWEARTGLFGTVIKSDKQIAHLNPIRLMSNAVHQAFTKEGQRFLDDATSRGLLRQEVSEIQKTLSDPLAAAGLPAFGRKVDKIAGFLSDRSEELSRSWAHMAGGMLAKQHGITNLDNIQIFAHRFANEVIGDYRANNRPMIFQGAVGMPLGLFQTWSWNYYQRLFSYIENAQWRAATTQFAMQASVFGAATVPGYALFNKMFTQVQDGENTPVDALEKHYGRATTDLLLYGTLSNIPKIFSDDGIAFYSRGDVTPRTPAFIDPREAPIFSLAENIAEIIGGTVGSVLPGGQGLSVQRELELLGAYSSSRPLKGLAELAAGYSVDRRGNVIEQDTINALSVASRVMGLRPMAEANEMAARRRLKITEASRYAKRTRMREDLKSSFRGGSFNPTKLRGALKTYLDTNGNPGDFVQFLQGAYLSAVTPGIRTDLIENLRSADIQDAMRLINATTLSED